MRESDLRRSVIANLPSFHWQAIETGGTGLGVPDLNGCREGVDVWLELKVVRAGVACPLTPTQVAWLTRRARAGGRVFVLVRWKDELCLFRGSRAEHLRELGMRLEPDWCWPARRVCWDEVAGALAS